jgi:RNA recognition motif-containing protein
MFPTLTSFEREINNPYMTRTTTTTTTTAISKPTPVIPSIPPNAPAASKLLISNLPSSFNEDSVYKFMRTFGKIKTVEMVKDPVTGEYTGQCHVEFETESATANALHCK